MPQVTCHYKKLSQKQFIMVYCTKFILNLIQIGRKAMDIVDEIISDWTIQRPDIDCSGKIVICRILRSFSHVIAALEKSLKPLGITPNIFSILVTIRRRGAQAEITVKTIMDEVLITSGAMSNLLNRLIELDLISKRRGMEEEDSRSAFIKLTSKGLALVDKAMEIQATCERKLTQALSNTEKQQLAGLLKKMLPEEHSYV